MRGVLFIDPGMRCRYRGRLVAEVGSHGHPQDILILTPERDGEEWRVGCYDVRLPLVLKATLDERSRLDRAGYRLQNAPKRWSPRG